MFHFFALIGVVVALAVIVFVAVVVLLIVSLWKIFKKANVPGWAALIPFYNKVKILGITNEPLWWILLSFVPIVNIVIIFVVVHRLAVVFGRGWWFTVGMIFLPFIFLPILGFGTSQYLNTYPPAGPMSEATKWSLIAALVTLVIIPAWGARGSETRRGPQLVMLDNSNGNATYVTDGTYVYTSDLLIPTADVRTFRLLGGDYAADRHFAYYESQVLPNVSPRSFHLISDSVSGSLNDYATDGKTVFYDGTPVIGADAGTFVVGEGTTTPPGVKNPLDYVDYDAKDANHFYSEGAILTPDNSDYSGY